MLVPVRGEFISGDWQLGLFDEKYRVSKLEGEKGNICSVVSFEYKGSIDSLRNYSISERMKYLKDKGSVGEIVRLKKPAGYIRFYPKLIPVKNSELVDLNQMRLTTQSARGRYCVLELKNTSPIQYKLSREYPEMVNAKKYSFLRGYYELEDAQKEIFGIMRSNHTIFSTNVLSYYYIYDTQANKAYHCQPMGEQLKTTTRQSDDSQIITPLYRHIYYGYAES